MKLRIVTFNMQHGAPVPEGHRAALSELRANTHVGFDPQGESRTASTPCATNATRGNDAYNASRAGETPVGDAFDAPLISIAREIQQIGADVVCLQEVDAEKRRSGYAKQAQRIADHLGWYYVFAPARGNLLQRISRGAFPRIVWARKAIRGEETALESESSTALASARASGAGLNDEAECVDTRRLWKAAHHLKEIAKHVNVKQARTLLANYVAHNGYGVAILSRFPIRSARVLRLPDVIELGGLGAGMKLKVPEPRVCLYARLSVPAALHDREVGDLQRAEPKSRAVHLPWQPVAQGEKRRDVVIASTHLTANRIWAARQLRAALGGFSYLAPTGTPSMLMGDFNMYPDGVAEVLAEMREGFSVLARGRTYPNWKPAVQIDHVLGRSVRAVEERDGVKAGCFRAAGISGVTKQGSTDRSHVAGVQRNEQTKGECRVPPAQVHHFEYSDHAALAVDVEI
ncbi:MAG: endonuclease/exonuclease/phosphatase family protein [Arcanobacterium sp.]|nr:endonuclease/exonuclease/phosphatase family protein [Arcanobacterium sp.]